MSFWGAVTWVRCADANAVAAALDRRLEAEGMASVPAGQALSAAEDQAIRGGADTGTNWWAALVAAGAGWTYVQTAPYELLAQRPARTRPPRLVGLCHDLGCHALLLSVRGDDAQLAMEVTSKGQVRVSGWLPADGPHADAYRFHHLPYAYGDRPTSQADLAPNLELIDDPALQRAFGGDAVSPTDRLERLAALLGGHPFRDHVSQAWSAPGRPTRAPPLHTTLHLYRWPSDDRQLARPFLL